MTSYLLAGGGTAGHVNPLLAVADLLRQREGDDVLVLGTKEGLESRLVPERGYELLIVDKVPFPPPPPLPRRERIPFVVHEANAKPGLANVLGARTAAAVGVAFDGTPLRRGEVVGMPLRREVVELDRAGLRAEAAEYFGLDADRPVLLVFGGSLGALRLNEAIAGSWGDVLAAGWQLLHATGERSDLVDPEVPGYTMRRYIDRMDLAFALADLIVSRAGSATVSEVSALGIPAVYVPYSVGNGEQRLNAASAVAAGAAVLLDDATFDADVVRERIIPLLGDRQRIEAMAASAERIGSRTGAEDLIALVDRALAEK